MASSGGRQHAPPQHRAPEHRAPEHEAPQQAPAAGRLALGLRRRLPLVLQTEAAECGLACLAMVAGYFGRHVDLSSLRHRFTVSLKGSTLGALMEAAEALGLSTRAVRLGLSDLARLRRPCILHWRFNHFVVLKAVGARTVTILDPAAGERRLGPNEVSAAFTGIALELWPSTRFTRADERQSVRLREMMGQVWGLYAALGQILTLALALEVFAVVSPLFLQWVIDRVLVAADRDLLTTLALGFGLLVLLQQATATLRAWVIMHVGASLHLQWHANVFSHLLRLPMAYFEKRHLGDTVSRFRSVDAIRRTLTTSFVETVADGLVAIVTLTVVFLYSPALAWICVGTTALYGAVRWTLFRPLRLAAEEHIVHTARQDSHFLETVSGVKTVKLFQRQNERRSHWLSLLVEQINAGLRGEKLHIVQKLAHGLMFGLENVIVIWLGARLVLDGALSAGMLMAFLAYKNQFTTRVSALLDKIVEVRMLRLQGERLADIVMTEAEETPPAPARHTTPRGAYAVELRELRYRYADHEPFVLDGIDLAVRTGESLALVGPSGCGKTTLLNVILGVHRPSAGRVLINGHDVTRAGAGGARAGIGAVLQDDHLFAGSIAENISFFADRIDQQRIEQCARMASIHDDILSMPMGYETFVGHMGSVLSGGQRQRVLLARALYKRPAILVLDEATNHLDLGREMQVNAAITALNMTRIIVTHRPQSAAASDRVVALGNGRIVKQTRPKTPHSGNR